MQILIGNLILAILWAVVIYCSHLPYKIKQRVYYLIIFVQIIIIRTFVRLDSLNDLENYYDMFQTVSSNPIIDILITDIRSIAEVGFLLLLKLVSYISDDFTYVLLFISLVWVLCYYKFFERYTNYIVLPIVMLLVTEFPQSLFVLRQHLAMAILLFSFPYILDRKFLNFSLIVLIAASIHTTAIIYFPIYFIYNIRSSKLLITFLILAGFALAVIFTQLEFLNSFLGLSYDSYITGDKTGSSNLTGFMIYSLYLLSFIIVLKDQIFNDGILRLIFILVSIGMLISLIGTSFSLTSRLVRYFSPACLILIPIVASKIQNKVIRSAYVCVVVIFNAFLIFGGSFSQYIKTYQNTLIG